MSGSTSLTRFRTRREAERVLAEIIADGGAPGEFRIDEDTDGSCVITIFESGSLAIAGVLGA